VTLSLEAVKALPTLAANCLLIGHAQRADVVWTKSDFLALCAHMANENDPSFFMIPYRDATGKAQFAKSRKPRCERHAIWAWDTITGKAKTRASIGFYPRNSHNASRWGAMDFDTHDGETDRAREWAFAAFQLLLRHPELFVVLATSGGGGWHLFIFSREFHHVEDWERLLKQAAAFIGADIKKGSCEIFPSETRGSTGYGIRAPGSWNPKSDSFGLIAFENVAPLCLGKENLFRYMSTHEARSVEFTYCRKARLYRGQKEHWREKFAITAPRMRRDKLKHLVEHIFRQVGYETALGNAELQYSEATVAPQSSIEEHRQDFKKLWSWFEDQWLLELTQAEREKLDILTTDNERSAFRIIKSFSRARRNDNEDDFKIQCESLGARLGITLQGAAKLRRKFESLGIIEKTRDCEPGKLAARFIWILQTNPTQSLAGSGTKAAATFVPSKR
jgi:hypothetical protein